MTTTLPPKSLTRRLRVAEALNHLIVVLSAANADYWNQSDDALIAEMNSDIAETMEQFQGNSEIAPVLNAWQERLAVTDANGNRVYSARVPTERGRSDIGFADGAFFIIPPPPVTEERPCPVCGVGMSLNWRDGQPYDYCIEHGEPVTEEPAPEQP